MRPGLSSAAPVVAAGIGGAALWTITEYTVHRFVMHGDRDANAFSAEHLDHHAGPNRSLELSFDAGNIGWKSAGFGLVLALVAPLAGPRPAAAAAATFTLGYAGYTELHDRIHQRPPRGAMARRVWKRHFQHHFSAPRRNYGVTTGVWDRVFRTSFVRSPDGADQPVTVPRRLAMPWLTDDQGNVRPEFSADYRLGTARSERLPASLSR